MSRKGVQATMYESPATRSKRSCQLELEGKASLVRIALWESGECEIQIANIATADVQICHRCLNDLAKLTLLLDDLVNDIASTKALL